MNSSLTFVVLLAVIFLAASVPVLGKNYSLHSPHLWSSQEKETVEKEKVERNKEQIPVRKQKTRVKKVLKEGVSYLEVTVKKGDTLLGIAKRYRRDGASYSEILRVNAIEDPGQIDVGNVIIVTLSPEKKAKQSKESKQVNSAASVQPVQKEHQKKTGPTVQPSSDISEPLPVAATEPATNAPLKPVPVEPANAPVNASTSEQVVSTTSKAGQKMYEQAIKSYRQGDCKTAIQLFGRFLAENRNSLLAADLGIFVADCYQKLSGK